jgi:hypothetical protein
VLKVQVFWDIACRPAHTQLLCITSTILLQSQYLPFYTVQHPTRPEPPHSPNQTCNCFALKISWDTTQNSLYSCNTMGCEVFMVVKIRIVVLEVVVITTFVHHITHFHTKHHTMKKFFTCEIWGSHSSITVMVFCCNQIPRTAADRYLSTTWHQVPQDCNLLACLLCKQRAPQRTYYLTHVKLCTNSQKTESITLVKHGTCVYFLVLTSALLKQSHISYILMYNIII